MRIRRLDTQDCALMREMLAMFGDAFEDVPSYCNAPPSDAYLSELLGSSTFIALAAISEDKIVAGLAAYILTKFEQERREIYIYDLAVLEPYRRRGIARALIEAVQRISTEISAYAIYVQADRGDDPAIALYRSVGIEEAVLHFDIPIPWNGPGP